MSLKYHSGEEVRKGDHIRLGTEPGVIEFVADPNIDDTSTNWYVQKYGGGVMLCLDRLGSVFDENPQENDELRFLSRTDTPINDGST